LPSAKEVTTEGETAVTTTYVDDSVAVITPGTSSLLRKRKRNGSTLMKDTGDSSVTELPQATSPSPKKKKSIKKTKTAKLDKEKFTDGNMDDSDTTTNSKTKKSTGTSKTAAAKHQIITDRDELPKLWSEEMAMANGSYSALCLSLLCCQIV
jgi:hypothetical protein